MRVTPHVAQHPRRRNEAARLIGRTGAMRATRSANASETGGARLRLDENDRRSAQAAAPWRPARDLDLHLHAAAYNIVRLRRLLPATYDYY